MEKRVSDDNRTPSFFFLRDDLRTGEDARVIRRGRFPNFVGCGYRIPFGPIRQRQVRSMGPVRKGAENSRRGVPRRGRKDDLRILCDRRNRGGIPVRKGWCRKKHDEPNDGLSFGFPCGRKRMLVLRRHPLSCVRNRTAFGAENVCPKHCFPVTRARRLRSPRPRRTCCRLRRSCLRRKPCCGRRPMPRRRSDGILPSVRMPRRGGKARFRPVRVEWPLS